MPYRWNTARGLAVISCVPLNVGRRVALSCLLSTNDLLLTYDTNGFNRIDLIKLNSDNDSLISANGLLILL